ncbi:MAG: hypothetical protein DMF37_11420, partial [Verrucomicrobia bacterium]
MQPPIWSREHCLCSDPNTITHSIGAQSFSAVLRDAVIRVYNEAAITLNQPNDQQSDSRLAHTQCAVRTFIGANRTTGLWSHDSI